MEKDVLDGREKSGVRRKEGKSTTQCTVFCYHF